MWQCTPQLHHQHRVRPARQDEANTSQATGCATASSLHYDNPADMRAVLSSAMSVCGACAGMGLFVSSGCPHCLVPCQRQNPFSNWQLRVRTIMLVVLVAHAVACPARACRGWGGAASCSRRCELPAACCRCQCWRYAPPRGATWLVTWG